MSSEGKISENLLSLSWHDSSLIPMLNQTNVMDYFSERSNPFYDRTCNNEILKMQKLGVADVQLQNMVGAEYILLHVQEPILYVIRKNIRHSPTQSTPVCDYYILGGVVYQAPDLGSVMNSRLLSGISHLQGAFEEARGYSRYHPSRGYWWDFGREKEEEKKKKDKKQEKEEPSSMFQRRRVDMLLDQLTRQFPHRIPQQAPQHLPLGQEKALGQSEEKVEKAEGSIKSEKIDDAPQQQPQQQQGIKRENTGVSKGPDLKKMKM